jgi:hypothetical protein
MKHPFENSIFCEPTILADFEIYTRRRIQYLTLILTDYGLQILFKKWRARLSRVFTVFEIKNASQNICFLFQGYSIKT